MSVKKTILFTLAQPYAVSSGRIDGQTVYFAASERRDGQILVSSAPCRAASVIADGPGGCMGLLPLNPNNSRSILAIEGFYPIFQSEGAGIALYTAGPDLASPWTRRRICDLPFLHRIAMVTAGGTPMLLAAALCSRKDFREDWSWPGALYRIETRPGDAPWPIDPIPLLDNLTKNHGLFVCRRAGRETVYIGADEGVFSIEVPKNNSQWKIKQIFDWPTSDIAVMDLDNDGEDEILTIEPFHGNKACVYKQINGRWQSVFEYAVDFGHVAWAGKIRGQTSMILGSRGGGKELILLTLDDASLWRFKSTILDMDVAPMNIIVENDTECDVVLAANGETNEVAIYRIT
jgi:hypothetical protein